MRIRWFTTHPAADHLAKVAPQSNSTSSGWAAMARARAGTVEVGREPGHPDRQQGRGGHVGGQEQVGGDVDVPGQPGWALDAEDQAQALGLGAVGGEGAGPVGEREAGPGGDRGHVGAVVVAVGDEEDAVTVDRQQSSNPVASGRSAWATITRSTPSPARCHTVVDRPVQAVAGRQSTRAPAARPRRPPRRRRRPRRRAGERRRCSTRSAISRASAARAGPSRTSARRSLARPNALTGTRTSTRRV